MDFKATQDLPADVKAATGGPGPQVALIATDDVGLPSIVTTTRYNHETLTSPGRFRKLHCISRVLEQLCALVYQEERQC